MDQFKQTLINAIQDNIEEMINPSREYTDKEIIWKRGYNQALKDKLKSIKAKMLELNSSTQPILKMILGLVTLPIKVISKVIQWIMDFFKGLTNPLTLPEKIKEFFSFEWIKNITNTKEKK
jgi:predicted house-cleaning noncanonical NTP pyrophosphatase (MazG superfamily)